MIECVNVFFVPMIALYLFYKRGEKSPTLPQFVLEYGIVTVAVLTLAKIVYKLCCIFFPVTWDLGSGEYTAMAFLASLLLVFLCEFTKKYFSVKVSSEENEKD